MITKVQNVVKSASIYGSQFEFNMSRRRTYTTALGALFTFVAVLLVSASVYIFVYDLIDTSQPQVTVSLENTNKYPPMSLFDEKIFMGFAFFINGKFPTIEESRKYITVNGYKKTVNPPATQNGPPVVVIKPFTFKRADDLTGPTKTYVKEAFEESESKMFRDISVIPDVEAADWAVQGSPTKLPYTTISLNIFPCSLPNPLDCANPQELSSLIVNFPFYAKSLDFTDKKNPVREGIDTDTELLLNLGAKTQMYIYYKRNEITNDDWDIIQPRIAHKFLDVEKIMSTSGIRDNTQFHCTPTNFATNTCTPYIQIEIRSGNKLTSIFRRYEKIFETISELGGFGDLIFIICAFFYSFYNERHYNTWIKGELFSKDFYASNKIDKKKMTDKEKEEIEGVIDEIIEEELDAVNLVKKMQKMNILFSAIFEPYHNKLLPKLMLKLAKDKNLDENGQLKKVDKNKMKIEDFEKEMAKAPRMSFDEALKELIASEPETNVEKKVKEFFLQNLNVSKTGSTSTMKLGSTGPNTGSESNLARESVHTPPYIQDGLGGGDAQIGNPGTGAVVQQGPVVNGNGLQNGGISVQNLE